MAFSSSDALRFKALFPMQNVVHRDVCTDEWVVHLKDGPCVRMSDRLFAYRCDFATYLERRLWVEWLDRIKDLPDGVTVRPDWLDTSKLPRVAQGPAPANELDIVEALLER